MRYRIATKVIRFLFISLILFFTPTRRWSPLCFVFPPPQVAIFPARQSTNQLPLCGISLNYRIILCSTISQSPKPRLPSRRWDLPCHRTSFPQVDPISHRTPATDQPEYTAPSDLFVCRIRTCQYLYCHKKDGVPRRGWICLQMKTRYKYNNRVNRGKHP